MKHTSGLSVCARPTRESAGTTKTIRFDPRAPRRALTADEQGQLATLDQRDADTRDIPPAPEANWSKAERGRFFKPRKEAISLRLDMDVLDWLRSKGPGYQTEINRILRETMEAEG